MSTQAPTMVDRLARIVRGDGPVEYPGDGAVAGLLEEAARHGVNALVADRVGSGILPQWPADARIALHTDIACAVALDALRQRELTDVLGALAARGVRPLLLKGTALAYTLYANPALRPRFDADIFVRRDDMDAVGEVMGGRGYGRPSQNTGELVMHQRDYTRKDAHGVWHVYDFHWKLANRLAVADMLSYDEMVRDAVPIAVLGPHARGLSRVHALMLACVHRVAHHSTDERLIWIYDIHLLAEALTPSESAAFAGLAIERGVTAVCADGLQAARRWFGTRLPVGILESLSSSPARSEPSAALLRPDGRRVDELVSDLRALPDWSKRLRLLYQHAFPSPAYMAGAYTVSNRAWLPALYAHRLVRGAWKWFRRGPR